MKTLSFLLAGLTIISLMLASYAGYAWWNVTQSSSEEKEILLNETVRLSKVVESVEKERDILKESLFEEKQKNNTFAQEIGSIASTVGTLEKIANTDEELLAKYSKTFFLNEHYTPRSLTKLATSTTISGEEEYFLTPAVPFLKALLEEAERDDISLRVISAYRSFETQTDLKSAYTRRYGGGANTFSADQGFSEHQLGTAVDFSSESLGKAFTQFGNDPAYAWLKKNAHRFGFILSYPKGNEFYIYEPWHWRFVGIDLATKLYEEEKYFYDLDQRTINEYLASFFDP